MATKNKVGLDNYLLAHTVGDLEALPRELIEVEPNLQVFIEELWPESDCTQIERFEVGHKTVQSPRD